MNRDDIIRMAYEVSDGVLSYDAEGRWILSEQEVIRLTTLVAAAEREACAKLCEKEQFELTQDVAGKNGLQHFDAGCRSCAEMIRARGET